MLHPGTALLSGIDCGGRGPGGHGPGCHGPECREFNYTVGRGQTVCKRLATAYEDTHYFAGFDATNGSSHAFTTDKFYS